MSVWARCAPGFQIFAPPSLPHDHPSILFLYMTSILGPVRINISANRITLQRPIFKTTLGNTGFQRPKFRIFSQFIAKFRLDNMTCIRYQNPSRLLSDDDCRFFQISLYIGMHSVTAHNFKFSPASIQKREFLSIQLNHHRVIYLVCQTYYEANLLMAV